MKNLIFVNGTMGVGKTTTCHELLEILQPSVFLDGDWCWHMKPFIVNEETKLIVESNIVHNLRNFLNCSAYEHVIFCWVMHDEKIMDNILNKLDDLDYTLYKFSLIASEEALTKRLNKDFEAGIRTTDILDKSLKRNRLYQKMNTIKIDVNEATAKEAALIISECISNNTKIHCHTKKK